MSRSQQLAITGYRGEPVPHSVIRQDGETTHLAILLSGMGYTCDMPLFYYSENILVDAGADVLRAEYAYNRRPEFQQLPDSEQLRWLFADTTAAYRARLARRTYDSVTLVGKSLGTLRWVTC